jgi:hypothetical protein
MSGPRYSFKKRTPLPGAYPKNFSPYILTNSSAPRAVHLTRTEIKNDLCSIQQAIAHESRSQYFDEVINAPNNEPIVDAPCQISTQSKIQRRNPRRPISSCVQAPLTEAEERKQIRAALKASQVEAARVNEFNRQGEHRKLHDVWGLRRLEADDGARLLRDVCSSGQILRTG